MTLAVEQTLNGLQFGVMLFLLAAGLTLVFGIMGVINLAHGSMYMIGAFVAASSAAHGAPFPLAVLSGAVAAAIAGAVVEAVVVRRLYGRNHLDQVLATFGLILIANDGVSIIWGKTPLQMDVPAALGGSINVGDVTYPVYRLLLIAAGILLAVALAIFVARTRLGALIRAGATHRELVGALGVDIVQLNTIVFALGALLAGVAGALLAPILSVQIGMGEQVLIMTFVAIVIGGLGSIRGAFVGALAIGVVDTLGRAYIPALLRSVAAPDVADSLGGGLSAVAIYVLMAIVLIWKPRGLFPVLRVESRRVAFVLGATLAVLVAVPVLAAIFAQPFWVNAATRIVIYGIVAISLDFIVGYGAMVSFGHAAFFALGGYVAGVLVTNGVTSALITWPAAMLAAALLAAGVGALSLRTSGVYFIMITLAFGQMVYYASVGLKMFGGTDGLSVPARSALPLIDLGNATIFYAVCALLLVAFFIVASRLTESRFGMVVRGAAESEKRMTALGFPVTRYRLVAFVIAGAAAGLAGALWADFSHFVSPDMASWTRSGEFLIMVILGGIGSLAGGLYGAAVLTGFESLFSGFTEHWMLLLGVMLILIVLFAKRGIYGLLAGRRDG